MNVKPGISCLLLAVLLSALSSAQQEVSAEDGWYVVRFDGPSLARANDTAARSAVRRHKLDARSAASRAFLGRLDRRQDVHLAAIADALGRGPDVLFRYRAVVNGAAVRLTAAEADAVRRLPGVVSVALGGSARLNTDVTGPFVGADGVWDGSAVAPLPASRGEGVVVGILDSGIRFGHASFSGAPGDGYVYLNPLGSGNFLGWCDPLHPSYDPSYTCNDKLIGAWDFADAFGEADGPGDVNFHGSHVTSIAAGNTLADPPISGLAPRAQVVLYDVCVGYGSCPVAAVLAAVDQAVFDGVDVLNYSIEGTTTPWNAGDVGLAFLDATAAGIAVVASASNADEADGTVRNLGPWVTTVGASTHDRLEHNGVPPGHVNGLVDLTGGAAPLGELTGTSLTLGYGPAPIVYEGDCSMAFAPGTWTGEIVVCDRDVYGLHKAYCRNVADGGGGGCVLIITPSSDTSLLASEHHTLPMTILAEADGAALVAWLGSGSGHQGTITPSAPRIDSSVGDRVLFKSGRGPNPSFDVLKPDLVAPGKSILGASIDLYTGYGGDQFLFLDGTSMSSAAVAGLYALLIELHPGWTPSELKSALMTTATTALANHDLSAVDPRDYGAGRPRPELAAKAGLVLDEVAGDYATADPGAGGDPKALNLPSFQDSACSEVCAWQRVVKSTLAQPVTWTASSAGLANLELIVSPPLFTLNGVGTTQSLDVAVRVDGGPLNVWVFGELVLTPDDPSIPTARMPVAVQPTLAVALPTTLAVTRSAGPTSVDEPGGAVTFTVRLDNTGAASADVSGLVDTVHGDLDGLGSCVLPQTIAPGAFYECSFAAQVDGNAGEVENGTAIAAATSGGVPLAAQGAAAVNVNGVAPSLMVDRTASAAQVHAPGENVTFSLTLTNTSPASSDPVTITSLVDDVHGNLDGRGDCSVPQVLAPGASFGCSYVQTVSGSGGETETSTTTAAGTDDDGAGVNAFDAVVVGVLESVPPTVTSVVANPDDGGGELADCRVLRTRPAEVVLTFSETLDAGLAVNTSHYLLVAPGVDRAFQSTACTAAGDDEAVALSAAWNGGALTATLAISPLTNGLYRFAACGLEDLAGNVLAEDLVRTFRVEVGNLFVNGQLDCNLDGWTQVETVASEVTHEPSDDGPGFAASGSASLVNLSGPSTHGLGQCVDLPAGSSADGALYFEARYRVAVANETLDVGLGCEAFDAASCGGSSLGAASFALSGAVTAGWTYAVWDWRSVPPGAVAVRCDFLVDAPVGTYFDAGADALRLRAWLLFADGFESGDTSAWTLSIP